ncbi:hypothetical protein [Nocardia sp. CA-145437]|uniref:hypothetical protein n=1 Tax=Nocardia sp. CA-145437 TaxID=3239980 RepID=UPI003D96B569
MMALALIVAFLLAVIGSLITYILKMAAGKPLVEAISASGIAFVPLAALGVAVVQLLMRR